MATAPRDQLCHIVVEDLGHQSGRPEVVDQALNVAPCRISAGVMLADLVPVSAGDIVQLRRDRRGRYPGLLFRPVAFCVFECFSFSPARASRRAVKPITFELEIEVVVRAIFVPID